MNFNTTNVANNIKMLLLALNKKSKSKNVSYSLVYTYLYSDKKNCMFYIKTINIFSFHHKTNEIVFKTNADLITFLSDERKKYTDK